MYIPNPYFQNISDIGNLTLDYIFIDDGYPILFTCINADSKKMYLCICRTLQSQQKWVISEITIQTLEKLIKKEICIKEAFYSVPNGKSCIITWSKDNPESHSVFTTSLLNEKEVPDSDVFLEDEYAEIYLEQVRGNCFQGGDV